MVYTVGFVFIYLYYPFRARARKYTFIICIGNFSFFFKI
jgi:hypothetical protein